MRTRPLTFAAALLGLALSAATAAAAPVLASTAADFGLKQGTADLKSAGPLAFGPNGILLVGDPQGAAVFAIDTNDRTRQGNGPVQMAKVDERIAGLLGTAASEIGIADMAVNPASGNVYFSVARGRGPEAPPVILKLDRQGEFTELSLKDVKFAKAVLPNPATRARERGDILSGLAYVDGKVYVAGLSNEEFASRFCVIPFPFAEVNKGTAVEIYHGSHGQLETRSPIRTFTPYEIAGTAHLLAAYTCTPLVKIPVSELKPGARIKGQTVAELGMGNRPLDMIVYQKYGKDYLLMSNSVRGVMKVALEKVGTIDGITARVRGTAGLPYETIGSLKGVVQLSKLDNDHALILVKAADGKHNLETIDLP
jgi:hypothetical protein